MGEPEQSTEEPQRPKAFDIMGWLGLVMGVAGLVTGYVYYAWTITYPEIAWWSTDQIVFNSQNANPDIRLIDKSGTQIVHNVYATNISISNAGSSLLERANDVNSLVRSPLKIAFLDMDGSSGRLLSASIVAVSEHAPVKLSCQLSDDSSLLLTWDHFDPGAGFRALMLYTAERQLLPDVGADVVGMNRPNHVDLTQRMKEIPDLPEAGPRFTILAYLVASVALVAVFFMVGKLLSVLAPKRLGTRVEAFSESVIVPFLEQKVEPFFKRHAAKFRKSGVVLGRLMFYSWLLAGCAAGVVLVVDYQPTLVAIWRYVFPSDQPPLAIASPANIACNRA
jgi:hypothetical protein